MAWLIAAKAAAIEGCVAAIDMRLVPIMSELCPTIIQARRKLATRFGVLAVLFYGASYEVRPAPGLFDEPYYMILLAVILSLLVVLRFTNSLLSLVLLAIVWLGAVLDMVQKVSQPFTSCHGSGDWLAQMVLRDQVSDAFVLVGVLAGGAGLVATLHPAVITYLWRNKLLI